MKWDKIHWWSSHITMHGFLWRVDGEERCFLTIGKKPEAQRGEGTCLRREENGIFWTSVCILLLTTSTPLPFDYCVNSPDEESKVPDNHHKGLYGPLWGGVCSSTNYWSPTMWHILYWTQNIKLKNEAYFLQSNRRMFCFVLFENTWLNQ